jgi:hypothetical protein
VEGSSSDLCNVSSQRLCGEAVETRGEPLSDTGSSGQALNQKKEP